MLLPSSAVNELSQRFAQSKQVSKMLCGEIRPSGCGRCPFAADLNDADDSAVEENRSADDFLNWIQAFAVWFYVLEYHGMTRGAEVVVDFRTAYARGPCRQGRIAGQGNKTHAFQRFRHQKM